MINIYKNDSINKQAWDRLLNESPTASWFQSYNCYQFYKKLDFLKPFAIAVADKDKILALVCGYVIADGGFVKRFMSRRAIVPGGVMIESTADKSVVNLLLKELKKHISNKAIYTEIRNFNDYTDFKDIFEETDFSYQPHLNFHLDSSDHDIAFKNLKQNKRRYVRLSTKEGAVWQLTTDKNEIEELYEILKDLYRTKVKTPLFPISFFYTLSAETDARIIVVKYKEKVVGGGVFVVLKNKCIYEWFVCGEDRHYKNVYPSILSTWGGIEYAANNNISLFDFMGAGKPNVEYGVRDFKAEFGGKLVEHGRFINISNKLLYRAGEMAVKVIRKIR